MLAGENLTSNGHSEFEHQSHNYTPVAEALRIQFGGVEVVDKQGICCCNNRQLEGLIVIGVTIIVTGFLWRSAILAPIKLVAVFLHEFSHASATWLTCGKVSGIRVNDSYGGVTLSRGGSRWIILSAGYTGSVVWGSFFILMTWDRLPTQIAAVVFMISCLVTALILKVEEKRICGLRCAFSLTMRILIVLLACIPAGLWVLEEMVEEMPVHPIRYCMLVVGTICTLHALYDCINDVLCKRISNSTQGKSDAVMFAEEVCGSAQCWGFLWSVIAVSAAGTAVFALTMLSGKCEVFKI